MNKQDKIDKIYEVIANKELSFGCIIIYCNITYRYGEVMGDCNDRVQCYNIKSELSETLNTDEVDEFEKIGHPVMIGDVLDWQDKNYETNLWGDIYVNGETLVRKWEYLRLPIESQSDECIDYIYELIK